MDNRLKTWKLLLRMAGDEEDKCLRILSGFIEKRSRALGILSQLELISEESSISRLFSGGKNASVGQIGVGFRPKIILGIEKQNQELGLIDSNLAIWEGHLQQARIKKAAYEKLLAAEDLKIRLRLSKAEQKMMDEQGSRSSGGKFGSVYDEK